MPEISICIPTYNCALYLLAAVESVMRQGLNDFEIVISDNASEDDTEAVVSALDNPHIRYFRNATNLGSGENGNRCLALAQGEFIKVLCADDVLLDGVLLKQLDILRRRPDVALVTCNMLVTDSELRPQKTVYCFPGSRPGARIKMACLSGFNNYIGGPSNTMFRRKDVPAVAVDTSYRWLSDLKFAFQVLERGSYFNIDEIGYLYRRHANSDTEVNCPPNIRIPEFLRLLDEFDGWTLLSCVQAIRRGGVEGIRAARARGWRACSISRLLLAVSLTRDILRMQRGA